MATKTKRSTIQAATHKDALLELQVFFNDVATADAWADGHIARLAGCHVTTVRNFRYAYTRFPRWQTVVALFDVVGYKITIKK